MAQSASEAKWRSILLGEDRTFSRGRGLLRKLPGAQRCRNCMAPLTGWAAVLTRAGGRGAYARNPRFCNL